MDHNHWGFPKCPVQSMGFLGQPSYFIQLVQTLCLMDDKSEVHCKTLAISCQLIYFELSCGTTAVCSFKALR